MPSDLIQYLIFDIESITDPLLVAEVRHPGEEITPEDALKKYREELMEKKGSDFVPYTYQVPVSLALAKVRSDFSLAGLAVLKCEDGGPAKITRDFWNGWRAYKQPTFVTFNGRGFDIPLMELAAFRYGVPIPEWFSGSGYQAKRNRFNQASHLDLFDQISNFGSTQLSGGLNLLSKMIAHPGKMETHGDMVQDMFDAGRFDEIHSYCRCDVLDTYFVFLRWQVVTGYLQPQREQELRAQAREVLNEQISDTPIYKAYLDSWDRAESLPKLDGYLESKIRAAEE